MRYSRVHIESLGYELPSVVVSTAELESRLKPFYDEHKLVSGQLELLTGISERRWWDRNFHVSDGATAAAFKALSRANVSPKDLDVLIYAGVCREGFEPATACAVASNIGLNGDASIFDLSNACLGVLNGVVEVANRIELGQAEAGLVVSCETAREINENVIDRLTIRSRWTSTARPWPRSPAAPARSRCSSLPRKFRPRSVGGSSAA